MEKTLITISETISKYNILDGDRAYVAYSGGKDSLYLCIMLAGLGYDITPIIVDIGIQANWEKALNNAREYLGINPIIIKIDCISNERFDIEQKMEEYINIMDIVNSQKANTTSVCTPCYNAKIELLAKWCEERGIKRVLFGHHANDSISSFLKSYFMYCDRYYYGNRHFEMTNYMYVARMHIEAVSESLDSRCIEFQNMRKLTHEKLIGTDEPPLQLITNAELTIGRPLFEVFEEDIVEYYKKLDSIVEFNKPECYFKRKSTGYAKTPREIADILTRDLSRNDAEELLSIVKESIGNDGYLKYDVRRNRNTILGDEYKPGFDLISKL